MNTAPNDWEPYFAQAEAKIASFDATGLDKAIAALSVHIERIVTRLVADENDEQLTALTKRLEQFGQQCQYLRDQLSSALLFAQGPDKATLPYTRSRSLGCIGRAPEHALLKRVL